MLDRIAERESAWLASTAPTPKVVSKQCLWQLGLARARSLFLSSRMENPGLLAVGPSESLPLLHAHRSDRCHHRRPKLPLENFSMVSGCQQIQLGKSVQDVISPLG
jgi:hypothetical protein